jgi:endoglucanase
MSASSRARLAVVLAALSTLGGCKREAWVPAKEPGAALPLGKPFAQNPFAGIAVYRAPYSNADQAKRRLENTGAPEAALLAKIADQPQARWYGSWSADIETVVTNYVNAAEREQQLALLVAYNIPNRDCGQYSAGGASDPEKYREWIRGYAKGIGARRAVVVLEPDAVPQLKQCLSAADQAVRLQLIREAVVTFGQNPATAVYIDAGHSRWVPAPEMAARLKQAGIEGARGFALNVSNYIADAELIEYGKQVVAALGVATHFIVDTSRNGNGPTEDNKWCNPAGRALGQKPSTETGEALLDAFVWVKNPGESDGECEGGPAAGQWFDARAIELAKNARW